MICRNRVGGLGFSYGIRGSDFLAFERESMSIKGSGGLSFIVVDDFRKRVRF